MPHCRGIVVCDLAAEPSNWRATEALEPFLRRHGVPALTGVDTRRLARHVREAGAVPCAFGTAPEAELRAAAASARGHRRDGPGVGRHRRANRASTPGPVSAPPPVCASWPTTSASRRPWCGLLTTLGTVTVVPAATTADEVLALEPDGVFLSNGPGDPAALPGPTAAVADLVGRVPIFGICLGHQILATALGGSTYKLPFGHHGANHPVQRLETGRGRDHEPEPQLRRRRRLHPGGRDHPCQPQRRGDRGVPLTPGAGLRRAVPPRGRPGTPRRPLPLRRLPRAHAGASGPPGRRRAR